MSNGANEGVILLLVIGFIIGVLFLIAYLAKPAVWTRLVLQWVE